LLQRHVGHAVDKIVLDVDVARVLIQVNAHSSVSVGVLSGGVGNVVDFVVQDFISGRGVSGSAGIEVNSTAVVSHALHEVVDVVERGDVIIGAVRIRGSCLAALTAN